MNTDITKSMSTNKFISKLPNPGIIKVSIPKIIQQAKKITMQKTYFDKTNIFRENGVAHNNVAALGNWYPYSDTYCKSIKTAKIIDRINPKTPVNSGVLQSIKGGIRTAAINMIKTYFLTIRKSFFNKLNNIIFCSLLYWQA